MDIAKKLHAIGNKRQIVLWGLESDATEADRVKAKIAFEEETKILNEMSGHVTPKKVKGKCQNKGCAQYDTELSNGCKAYEFISICVDSRKVA